MDRKTMGIVLVDTWPQQNPTQAFAYYAIKQVMQNIYL